MASHRGCGAIGGLALLACLAFAEASAPAPAAAGSLVGAPVAAATAARLSNRADAAEIVLALSRSLEASAFTLSDPDRIILDLPQIDFRFDPAALDPAAPEPGEKGRHRNRRAAAPPARLVTSVRFGSQVLGRSRVVIGLSRPARIVSDAVERDASGGSSLVLRLAATDRAGIVAAVPAQPAAAAEPAATPSPSPRRRPRRRRGSSW